MILIFHFKHHQHHLRTTASSLIESHGVACLPESETFFHLLVQKILPCLSQKQKITNIFGRKDVKRFLSLRDGIVSGAIFRYAYIHHIYSLRGVQLQKRTPKHCALDLFSICLPFISALPTGQKKTPNQIVKRTHFSLFLWGEFPLELLGFNGEHPR